MTTVDRAAIDRHGLKEEEYDRILRILGREPTLTELGIFSVMWSEHCSYKSSRVHLRTLPTTGRRVVQGPGENAGAVDIGDGLAAVFKIESHNHPSFIEPYQGAATGVGGIIRDIFTMGARPIALLDSLRFGPLDEPRNRRIMEGVVAGIAGYGNSIGIPTIAGEIAFDDSYSGNPLVNVLCLGIAEASALVKGVASGVGNPVYYVGARTGRDGIHGATMASAEFDDRSAEKRPAVQVGDPFMEKLLLEACLELLPSGAIVGLQDMGAAGLTCSTCEMGARAGTGVEIDVSLVPQRETGMTPYEIMLSESQERMLLVVAQGREAEVERVFDKWDLHAVRIGCVTGDGVMRVRDKGTVVAEIPSRALADEAPLYERPMAMPAYLDAVQNIEPSRLTPAPHAEEALLALLASPTIASKRWVYRQYDYMVRTNTVLPAGAGPGVVRVKGTKRALAISVDGNGRFCYLYPYRGAMLAVAEAARNVACAGALPIGATNCLNFGNPERPEIMWQFARAVAGLGAACRALDIPITGGNVSLYNETDGRAVLPTPVIGVVGLIDDADRVLPRAFTGEGHAIVLLGETFDELGGSEYLKTIFDLTAGLPPALDVGVERSLHILLVRAAADGILASAHDCSEGGVAVTLAECAFGDSHSIGADVNLPAARGSQAAGGSTAAGGSEQWREPAATLFSESASRAIVSVTEPALGELMQRARAAGVPAQHVGRTGGTRMRIAVDGRRLLDLEVSRAREVWATALERRLSGNAA